jgi:5,10-methylenetetrahydromethanopterin reductase
MVIDCEQYPMRMSLFAYLNDSQGASPVDAFVRDLRAARDRGFERVWTVQLPWEQDVLTTLAVAAREVDGIGVATGVLPIQGRQPMVLAQAALTMNLVAHGRFTLGIGLTHQFITEGMWGVPWDRPVRRLNEYLDGLLPLLAGEEVDARGDTVTTRGRVDVPGATAPPVYVAALGPQLLRVAGRRTAGTLTWLVGPRTLAEHVVPTLTSAANDAGRQAEVVAALPVCVTDDAAKARELAVQTYAIYGTLPSYRAMLDREGAGGPEDVAIIGDERSVGARLEELQAAGVAEFAAHVFGASDEDRARTRALLSPA